MSLNGIAELRPMNGLYNKAGVDQSDQIRIARLMHRIKELEEKLEKKMIVCPECKKQMQNIKSGVAVRYNIDGTHAYMGDRYVCSCCGKEVIWCNTNPRHDNNYKKDDIYMQTTYHDLFPRTNNIRQLEEERDGPILQ